jgi:hypothetical protein
MNLQQGKKSIDDAFDRYLDKLIDVLMIDIGFDRSKADEYFRVFFTGLDNAATAHARINEKLYTMFPSEPK